MVYTISLRDLATFSRRLRAAFPFASFPRVILPEFFLHTIVRCGASISPPFHGVRSQLPSRFPIRRHNSPMLPWCPWTSCRLDWAEIAGSLVSIGLAVPLSSHAGHNGQRLGHSPHHNHVRCDADGLSTSLFFVPLSLINAIARGSRRPG